MREWLATYDSRGGVEPLAALGARLRALGAEVLVRAPLLDAVSQTMATRS